MLLNTAFTVRYTQYSYQEFVTKKLRHLPVLSMNESCKKAPETGLSGIIF